jgi:hypothetical protein
MCGYDFEMDDVEQGKLSEAKVKAAFADLDWPTFKSHLDKVVIDDATLDELVGHLRRAGGLIHRYPKAKQEARRDRFLQSLREYIQVSLGDRGAGRVADEVALLLQIQRGYRSLLAELDHADVSKMPPAARIAACLDWSVRTYADIITAQANAAEKLDLFLFPNVPSLVNEDGRPVSIDAVINAIVCAFSTSLIMLAHSYDWKDPAGTVVIPELPATADDEIYNAGAMAALAMCWSRWQRTEERRRYLGGTLEEFTAPNLPNWCPTGTILGMEYTPGGEEFFDYAANERLMDVLGQNFMRMMTETNVQTKVSGIDRPIPLAPTGIVSVEEVHAAVSLSDILKYDITRDLERPGGMRLIEWVRGGSLRV